MKRRPTGEMGLFLLASTAGIYGFGQAFHGSVLWLVIAAVALVILSKQMGRVQDQWPRRDKASRAPIPRRDNR